MTTKTVETTGGRRGDGDGLRGSAINASTHAAWGDIIARKRLNYLAIEQKKSLPISRSVIEWPERPTVVPRRRLSRESRCKHVRRDEDAKEMICPISP
jgi:hypothetical protein